MSAASLLDLQSRGVRVRPHEAVAIAQTLIHNPEASASAARLPFGPPTPETVEVGRDGSVVCTCCAATPAVSEIAILLQALLPPDTKVPGGLRYAISRALLEVDAPPFDSVGDFARTLSRFERGDREEVVRSLLERVSNDGANRPATASTIARAAIVSDPPIDRPQRTERRRMGCGVDELRRQLREVDRLRYEALVEIRPGIASPRPAAWRAPAVAGAALAAAIALIAVEQLVRDPYPRAAVPPPPPVHVSGTRVDAGLDSLVSTLDAQHRPVFSPAFASNGTAMFFHTGRGPDTRSALMAMDMTSPRLRVTSILDDGARNYHVQPSPDERLIAFDSDRDGERGVYVASRDGSNVRRVSGRGYAAVPSWSPDSRQIAFIRAETNNPKIWNLWLLTMNTGELRRLTQYPYGQTWTASWFPDGRRLCYTHEDRLVILDLGSGRQREFDSPVANRLVRTPAVSPDGSKVIFQVYQDGVWLLDLGSGAMRSVLADPSAEEFAWAPDGRRVAFHSRRAGQWGIYMLPAGGS